MTYTVKLVVSPLGGIPGATAYHSSILVDNTEFSFSPCGIEQAHGPVSHEDIDGRYTIIDMGSSQRCGEQMLDALDEHFEPGTYDLLHKNCNSFVDCALCYFVQKRLRPEYRMLERVGAQIPSFIQAVSGGEYIPDPEAMNFDQLALVRSIITEAMCYAQNQTGGDSTEPCVDQSRPSRLSSASVGSGEALRQKQSGKSNIDSLGSIMVSPESLQEKYLDYCMRADAGEVSAWEQAPTAVTNNAPLLRAGSQSGAQPCHEADITADVELVRLLPASLRITSLQADADGITSIEALPDEQLARSPQAREFEYVQEDCPVQIPDRSNGHYVGTSRSLEPRASKLEGLQGFMACVVFAGLQFNEQLRHGFCAPALQQPRGGTHAHAFST